MAELPHGSIDLHPFEIVDDLDVSAETLTNLGVWIDTEITRAEGARSELRAVWEINLRLYEAIPEMLQRNVPFINASNLEIPIAAIACEAVYAQMLNAIFNIDPLLTCREVGEEGRLVEHVKALQRFTEVLTRKITLRSASENALLDDIKLGTGILYTRWSERSKKTLAEPIVTKRGPDVRAIAVEDFYVPGGATDDLDGEEWCGIRYKLTQHQLNTRARDLGWDIEDAQEYATIDRVRQIRERLGRYAEMVGNRQNTASGNDETMYEVFEIYCYYDIDDDGIDEDLLVAWDRGSRRVLHVRFNPYDRRPFSAMRYQLREFLFYGMSVTEMMAPFQRGASNTYNYWLDNALLANARFYVGRHGSVPNNQLHIWPNRFLPVLDPERDFKAIPMADTYPSMPGILQMTMAFAERRSGLPEISGNRPAGGLGTRTPGITAMTLMQKANERFGPAFDQARFAVTDAMRQAVMRYQERVLANDEDVINDIYLMLGEERGGLLIELFKMPGFGDSVAIELTASTAQVNRDAEKQNWILLMQQFTVIFDKVFMLTQVMESPQMGPLAKQVAQRIIQMMMELLDRVYRSFDQVRDPATLLLNIREAMAEAEQSQPPQALAQLGMALEGMFGGGESNGAGAGEREQAASMDAFATI